MADEQAAQVVDAVGVVGMLMGDQDRIEPVDPALDQLFALVVRAISSNGTPRVCANTLAVSTT